MNSVLALAAIVMLVLLFLKVPVYIAILGGSARLFSLSRPSLVLRASLCWQFPSLSVLACL